MPRPYGYVFGPVPSRRLGRSLGVDLVPFKTCTYDCIYCQLGRTTAKTRERREYVPVADVLSELRGALSHGPPPDYVTLSGSGEPTLHSRLGEVIDAIKNLTEIPLAVLTNGSLLWDRDVRRSLKSADLVIPSLDAGDGRVFHLVNRPHPDLSFSRMVEGLRLFRDDFRNLIWLEVFLLAGVTGVRGHATKVARLAREIRPDRIHLNTVSRPPAEDRARPVPEEILARLAGLFEPRAEVISESDAAKPVEDGGVAREDILALLSRRPCTMEDVAGGLGMHAAEAAKLLAVLAAAGKVKIACRDGRHFYTVSCHENIPAVPTE
jgi:wyosine [tRNA(Phe)-imidazoG37] synthetase (radical SAM superfamily)